MVDLGDDDNEFVFVTEEAVVLMIEVVITVLVVGIDVTRVVAAVVGVDVSLIIAFVSVSFFVMTDGTFF